MSQRRQLGNLLFIRRASIKDLGVHTKWSDKLGWQASLHKSRAKLSCDPTGWLTAVHQHTGKHLGFISCLKFGMSSKATMGDFIVHEDYRGRGIGSEIMNACLEYLKDQRTILLYATAEGMPMYIRRGFTEVRSRVCVYKMQTTNSLDTTTCTADDDRGTELVQTRNDMIPDLISYDTEIHTVARSSFLTEYLGGGVQTVVEREQGVIQGYGCLEKRLGNTYLLGPVYANSPDTGQIIFSKLVSMVPEKSIITFHCFSDNHVTQSLASDYGATLIIELPCMVKGKDAPVPLDKVFCVNGVDFGLV